MRYRRVPIGGATCFCRLGVQWRARRRLRGTAAMPVPTHRASVGAAGCWASYVGLTYALMRGVRLRLPPGGGGPARCWRSRGGFAAFRASTCPRSPAREPEAASNPPPRCPAPPPTGRCASHRSPDRGLAAERLYLGPAMGAVRQPGARQGPVGGMDQPVFAHPGPLVGVALLALVLGRGARRQDLDDPVRGAAAGGIVLLAWVANRRDIRLDHGVHPIVGPRRVVSRASGGLMFGIGSI
jgi:hypothetical protein